MYIKRNEIKKKELEKYHLFICIRLCCMIRKTVNTILHSEQNQLKYNYFHDIFNTKT